jgi:two-component system cell cycle response regulator CtrA
MRYLIAETSWTLMTLAQELSKSGVLLTRTDRPEDIPQFLELVPADLLVVDDSLFAHPGLSLPVLRRLRPGLPIAVLSQDTTPDRIARLLAAGADTVLDASLSPEEIGMYLAAIARRAHGLAQPLLHYGPLRIDVHNHKAYLQDCPIKLSPKVYELLEYFGLRPRRLISRSALLGHVYGLEDEPDPRVFDVYVCNLRTYLAPADGAVGIETVRGVGYRFVAPCIRRRHCRVKPPRTSPPRRTAPARNSGTGR